MMYALKLSNKSPENFNKFVSKNTIRTTMHSRYWTLADTLFASLGTAERGCHVPLVWRTDKELAELTTVSAPTYRRRKAGLIDAGHMFEISSTEGSKKTIKVLKAPETSELDALYVALETYKSYCERSKKPPLLRVIRAVKRAIRDREAAETFSLENDENNADIQLNNRKTPTETLDETTSQKKDSFIQKEENFLLPPYIDKEMTIPFQEERAKRNDRKQETKPTHQPPKQTAEVVDFEHLRSIRLCIVQTFGEFGKAVDEGVAMKLSRAYAQKGATPEALQVTLDAKLIRLFGDGYRAGQVAAFLLKDASEWQPDPPKTQSKRRSGSPKTQSEMKVGANNFDENTYQPPETCPKLSRISELEAQGFSYFDAVEIAESEH